MLLKLIDPIGQSVLIVFFLYCIDAEKTISYRSVLMILVAWQIISVFINFFLGELKLLKNERILYLVTITLYMTFFFLFEHHVKEQFIALDEGVKATIPLHRVITMSIAIIIAFWYNIICYREIRTLLGGVINRGNES